MVVITKYRAVVYICGLGITKVLDWRHGERPHIGESCLLILNLDRRMELVVENVIVGSLAPGEITTCFFRMEDENLFFYLCDHLNECDGWEELSKSS